MKIDLAPLQNAFTGLKNDFAMMRNGFAALFHGFAPMRDAIAKMYGRYAMMQAARAMMLSAFLPALERREVLPQSLAVLVGGEVLAGVLVELVEELHADLYHLVHRAVLREVAVGEAVLAVVGIVAHDLVAQRHAATLAEVLDFREGIVHRCCCFTVGLRPQNYKKIHSENYKSFAFTILRPIFL